MLNKKKAYSYFIANYAIRESTNNWYSLDCPFCLGKKKSAVNFNYEFFKCFKCGERHGIIAFVMLLEGMQYMEAKNLIHSYDETFISIELIENSRTKVQISKYLPEDYKGILEGDTTLGKRARKYLKSRGLILEELDAAGWGYVNTKGKDYHTDYFGYLVIPFKRGGKLYYFQTRGFLGQEMRYKNPSVEDFGIGKSELIYNQDALILKDKVFLTEGVFDAKTIGEEGVGILGKSLSRRQFEIIVRSPVAEVIIALDEGCENESRDIAMELLDYKKVKILKLEGGDPNELGRERIYELYEEAVEVDYSDLI